MDKLTEKQQAIVDYLVEHHAKHHCSPTIRELAHHFDIQVQAMANHLKAILRKGALVAVRSAAGRHRGWIAPGSVCTPDPENAPTWTREEVLAEVYDVLFVRGHIGGLCVDRLQRRYCFPLRYWLDRSKEVGCTEDDVRKIWPDFPGWPA